MTLIAAFPCKNSRNKDAFTICADAQETTGDYRFFLDKLEPKKTGNYEIVIGGSGYGDLIEAFELRLTETLSTSGAKSIDELRAVIQAELLDFTRIEVQAFGAPKKIHKLCRFIIGARAICTNECECWVNKASRLKPVRSFELIGIDDPFYRHIAKRLYSRDMRIGQALRVCLYLFTIAKDTSTGIGGPTSLAVLQTHTLFMEEQEYIREAEEHLRELTVATDNLSVALPDIGMSAVEFEATLQEFVRTARAIRTKYITMEGKRFVQQVERGQNISYPYSKLPDSCAIHMEVDNDGQLTGEFTVTDDPYAGLYIGRFEGDEFSSSESQCKVTLCGRRREVGNRVYAEVVPCKLGQGALHYGPQSNCIEDTWLQTIGAKNSED